MGMSILVRLGTSAERKPKTESGSLSLRLHVAKEVWEHVKWLAHPHFVTVVQPGMVFKTKRQMAAFDIAPERTSSPTIGGPFGLVWLKIDGAGIDGFYSIYQGHLRPTPDTNFSRGVF